MSGGRLVVLDRTGRDVKRFPLAEGLATLGSDPACDIRIMLPTVSPHHATVVVHANQTVVRNVCEDETLVNGRLVSVAALRHGDVISIGGRQLRWEYTDPTKHRPQAPEPALYVGQRGGRPGRSRRTTRRSGPAGGARDPQLQLALEMSHRASMPGNAGGKQVAIVQPQRRDTSEQIGKNEPATSTPPSYRNTPPLIYNNVVDKNPPRSPQANKRPRTSKSDPDTEQDTKRKSTARLSPKGGAANLQNTTKATLWIESRKTSPRRASGQQAGRASGQQVQTSPRRASGQQTGRASGQQVQTSPRRASGQQTGRASGQQVQTSPRRASGQQTGRASGQQVQTSPRRASGQQTGRASGQQVQTSPRRASGQQTGRASGQQVQTSPRRASGQQTGRASGQQVQTSPRRASGQQAVRTSGQLQAQASPSPAPRRSSSSPRLPRSLRKPTPLRLTVLRRAQSASKISVAKIEGPLKMDHTKQAAIRLMTGHTSKPKPPSPSFVVNKRSPVRRTPRTRHSRATPASSRATPANRSGDRTVTVLEITDSEGRNSSLRNSNTSRRSAPKSPKISSVTSSPRKSALKDPSAKRGGRKTESIKFDLSNLESRSHDDDLLMLSTDEDDVTLRYSPSPSPSPSPRRPIHSRDSRLLSRSLVSAAPPPSPRGPPPPPRTKRSSRGSLILQKALDDTATSSYSRRTTQSVSDDSRNTTVTTARRTRTLSPRASRNELESYSIVDLVSIDTEESAVSPSVYNSAGSTTSASFGTPQNSVGRKTRSTIDPTLLGSSTPYVKGGPHSPRSRSSPGAPSPRSRSSLGLQGSSIHDTRSTVRSSRSRRSKSLSTPENTEDVKKHISVNSTRISRASRSRSRLNDSELLLLDDDDDSPRTSKRTSTTHKSGRDSTQAAGDHTELTPTHTPAQGDGTFTPENRHSPEEPSTPVLSIQSLLDSSHSSFISQRPTKKGRPSFNTKRKTIAGVTGPKARVGAKSKSLSFSTRKTRLRLSSESVEVLNKTDDSEIVTPKSAVKLVPEGVKNKHSTAKKPQSKRSIIDDLNQSDIVKQLFNSPVKRKLSQSMTEFSRNQLFEDDELVQKKRPTRNTIAITGRTPDNSLLDHTESYTPDMFVSPISTPTRSPSLEGIKLMFAKTTPENDLRNVRGVKALLRTPRTRRSIKNDLTDVSGVKEIFAKSPKNRLSDVRVKEVFVSSPKNDLRRVTGVKSLFQTADKRKSPRNELNDVRGVKKLFNTKSPANDLRNVSGVKRTLRRHSPGNDLRDVRGVKRVFRREARNDLSDVSGVEELFNLSNYSSATVSTRAESLFDQLVGKPQVRAVYSKTFSSKTVPKKSSRGKTLHVSLDKISAADNNWLEQELNKRLQIKNYLDSLNSANISKVNRTKTNKSKSSHASLDEVTDVDELLEQDLNKDQHINKYLESMRSVNNSRANKSKVNKSRGNKSRVNKSKSNISRANVSRELLKLVTDTVEGEAPLCVSRVRSGAGGSGRESGGGSGHVSHAERKEAPSEMHLPIKKRSLVEGRASVVAGVTSVTSMSGMSGVSAPPLPLKKRGVPHSTPVKRQAGHLTLNASVLARVSPIRADDDTMFAQHDASITSTQPKETTEVRPKSTRGTRANAEHVENIVAPESVQLSPKKTRGRTKVASPKAKPTSPVKIKHRKVSQAKAKKASPAKSRKATPTKVSPVMARKTRRASPAKLSPAKVKIRSPAKAKKASLAKAKKASPAKAKKASPAKAEKASPAKAKKASPAMAKKASSAKAKAGSPVKKASPKKPKIVSPAKKLASPVPVKTTRSRRNNVTTLESNTKKRGASLVVAKKSPVMSPKPRATRKRNEPETTTTPYTTPKKTRATRKDESVKEGKSKTPKNTRAKVLKATVVVSKPSPQLKPRATRRGRADLTQQEPTRNTRTTVAIQDTPEPPKKSQLQRKSSNKTRVAEVLPKTRGRKTVVSETKDSVEVEKPEAKAKKGRKTDEPEAKKTRNNRREKSIEDAKPVRTRGKKVETQESVESAPSTRGRRGAQSVSVTTEVKTRKRKSDTAPDNEKPSKVRKSKEVAEKRATEVSTQTITTRKKSAVKESKEKVSEVTVKVTRGRNTDVEQDNTSKPTERKTRGRKANIENVPANKVTGKRKRQATAEPSPVKERKTRATRGNTQPEGKPAGRSRRR